MELFGARIRTTIESLRDGLPDRITAFNAASTTVQLTAPADDSGALRPRRPELGYVFGGSPHYGAGEFPVVEVAIPDALIENLAISQVEGDFDASVVVAIWVGRTGGEDFDVLYEIVTAYAECITDVLLQPDAIYPGETVDRIRFAFAANPDRRERDEMETFTFGGFLFVTTEGVAQRS